VSEWASEWFSDRGCECVSEWSTFCAKETVNRMLAKGNENFRLKAACECVCARASVVSVCV